MPLDSQNTILAGAPYYDDFSTAEANNYHRVLFKPSVAVQARELTQLQTILQNQIERFGDNIYKRGTILSGCNIYFDANYHYIKVLDSQIDGISVVVDEYANSLLESTTGLQALVTNQTSGLVAQAPDLNTLYIKYTNVGLQTLANGSVSDVKVFSANTVVTAYNRNRRVERVNINLGGTGYSNTDTITFIANNDSGTGAQASLSTYSNGTIAAIAVTSKGTGYVNPPAVIINSTSGVGADVQAINYIGQLQIANTFHNSVGVGFAVKMDDGYAYQKGHFIKVPSQTLIVEKYQTSLDGYPNNAVIGFKTTELIANNSTDTSLNDNASGSTNEGAPGADRLQLQTSLIKYTPEEASLDSQFLTLVEFQNGVPVRTNLDTSFNSLDAQTARRTFEESGNYVVRPFGIFAEEKLNRVGSTSTYVSNTTHLNVVVSPGVAYINGVRTELQGNYRLPVRKATDTTTVNNRLISTNYGNYVLVNELAMAGTFNALNSSTVVLYDTEINALTISASSIKPGAIPTMPSGSIGTAKIRGVEYDSGDVGTPTAQYKVYLYDIKMNQGKAFINARSIGNSSNMAADLIVQGTSTVQKAVLNDVAKDGLVFPVGVDALKSISDTTLLYRTVNTSVTFGTGGTYSISFGGAGPQFPYTIGSTLSTNEENEFVIIPTSTTQAGYTLASSNVSCTSGTTNVTGSGTSFTTDFRAGDVISVGNSTVNVVARVVSVTNNISMVVTSNGASNAIPTTLAGNTYAIQFPAYSPIHLARNVNAKVTVDLVDKVTINLGLPTGAPALNATMPAIVYHNALISNPSLKTKKIQKGVFIKVSATAVAAAPNGPWCLGHPDIHKITGVYLGTSTTYANPSTATNYASQFELVSGQTDNLYGLSYVRRAPGSSVITTGGTVNLLVKCDVYYDHNSVSGGAFFAGSGSYPIDDVLREANTISITTEEIDRFVSTKTGYVFDLRNSLDFRPIVANTIPRSTDSANTLIIDPGTTETISTTTNYYPSPLKYVTADLEYYFPRYDVLSLTSDKGLSGLNGTLVVTEGVAAENPSVPAAPDTSMPLAVIAVPPYPSLDPANAKQADRNDLAVRVTLKDQQKRYTMKEIGEISKRIDRLEYYSLLTRLESSTKDLAAGRTLNGFFVDSFDNFEMTNVNDNEYNAFIDTQLALLRPRIYSESIDLKLEVGASTLTSGVDTSNPDQVLLNYTTKQVIKQPFASRVRNTAAEFWRFKGNLFVYPKYDGQYDRDVAPVSITIDVASAQQEVIDAVNQAFQQMDGKVTVQDSKLVKSTSVSDLQWQGRALVQDTITASTYNNYGIVEKASIGAASTSTLKDGQFATVSDVTFKPFMRSAPLVFFASGLRPGARHYVFFDDIPVNQYVIPGQYDTSTTVLGSGSVKPTGLAGGILRADANGVLAGIFTIPSETFYVGERKLKILDVADLDSENAAVSFAETTYNAYNFNVDHQQVSISTKSLDNVTSSMKTTFSGYLGQTTTITQSQAIVGYRQDPLAQTFLVSDDIKKQTDTIYVSHVDVFFQSVGENRGITIQLRDVVNGYPGSNILPFGAKWAPPATLTVSDDSTAFTRVTFDSPVAINAGQEYALVVLPDGGSPDFYIWTGEAGQADASDPNIITKSDWGSGQLFTSVNGSAWNPHSFEDLKFTLYRASFAPGSIGTASLTHDNYEFLTLADISGSFTRGDRIAQKSSNFGTGTILTSNQSFAITGVGTTFDTTFAVGDSMLVVYGQTPSSNLTGYVSAATDSANLTGTGTAFGSDVLVGDTLNFNGNVRKVIYISNTTNLIMDAPASNAVSSNTYNKFSTIDHDIFTIRSVDSSTQVTVDAWPKKTANTTVIPAYMKVVAGVVDRYRQLDSKLFVKKSNASNSTFKFIQSAYTTVSANSGRHLVTTAGSVANVSSINNIAVNYVEADVRTVAPKGTAVSAEFRVTTPGSTMLTPVPGSFTGTTTLPFVGEIRSRSNEISGTSIVPSFKLVGILETSSEFVSPSIDVNPASVQAIRNVVDDYSTFEIKTVGYTTGQSNLQITDTVALAAVTVGMGVRGPSIKEDTIVTGIVGSNVVLSKTIGGSAGTARTNVAIEFHPNEVTRYGISQNKYVSKFMSLADGMEAEDMILYITAFKPAGTEVDVYAKFINAGDGEDNKRKEWTKLVQSTNVGVYSDPFVVDDIKEYKYSVPKTPPFTNLVGKAATTATSNAIAGDSTSLWQVELAVGDLIKLVNADGFAAGTTTPVYGELDNYWLRTVTAISSNSAMQVDSAIPSSATGLRVQKVTQPRAAFLYNGTTPGYQLTYHGAAADGTSTAQHRSYKYVAIKIVPRASSSLNVPLVKDVRAMSVMV